MTTRVVTALIAEDHPSYRARVSGLLTGWGLETVVAVDGHQAIRALEAAAGGRIDLLVTDLEMPHFTGFEVIDAWLRGGGRPEAVIMVTGEADSRDVQDRCAAGNIRLIHKLAINTRFESAVREALRWLETRGASDRA